MNRAFEKELSRALATELDTAASTYTFGSAIYYIPDENKIRAEELIKTIIEEHYTSEPSTSDG